MKIYFVRHGESEGNAIRVHQGPQTPLSDVGLSQARMVAHRFLDIPVEVILSSDYVRTAQTAQTIQSGLRVPIEHTPLLREIKRPSEIEGKKYDSQLSIQVRETIKSHREEKDWHYSDEENFFDLTARAWECLKMLEGRPEQKILAVTHGLFLCTLISVVVFRDDLDPELFEVMYHGFHSNNTGITIFEHKDGDWRLLTWNDHDHLGAL